MSTNKSNIYQFKIVLKNIKPKIWRRIQIPSNYNFFELHAAIQDAMGWYDCHLHQFEMKTDQYYGLIIGIDECDELDKKAKLSKYFIHPKDRALYEYDFGDGWEHEIILEKILSKTIDDKYPKCIAGKRACPPEDCGGFWGYEDLLIIMKNPNHEEYAERIEWLGEKFDSETFDPGSVSFRNLLKR